MLRCRLCKTGDMAKNYDVFPPDFRLNGRHFCAIIKSSNTDIQGRCDFMEIKVKIERIDQED